ncbi:MAG: MotA/TolQ/ExbB proton channel family protein [Myxococcales bacterium FL481]|nr:MAG: MotA/TolQ/ExbB proton channel family protein [Myxococcales bacterium FL481]
MQLAQQLEILERGGAFMAPILLLSVVGLTVFFERLTYLRDARILGPRPDVRRLRELIEAGDRGEIAIACEQLQTPLARVLTRGLAEVGGSKQDIREAMEGVGRAEVYLMKRRVGAISAIATIAPFMGLLGTVVGMISMFQGVVASAQVSSRPPSAGMLADGIWVALLTTAAGLAVAIPLYLGHRFVVGRIGALVQTMEGFARDFVDHVAKATSESERMNR